MRLKWPKKNGAQLDLRYLRLKYLRYFRHSETHKLRYLRLSETHDLRISMCNGASRSSQWIRIASTRIASTRKPSFRGYMGHLQAASHLARSIMMRQGRFVSPARHYGGHRRYNRRRGRSSCIWSTLGCLQLVSQPLVVLAQCSNHHSQSRFFGCDDYFSL